MYLIDSQEKKKYKIVNIIGGRTIKAKLMSLGLFKSSTIEILKNDFSGPLILAFKSTRISIGRKIAKKIEVEEI